MGLNLWHGRMETKDQELGVTVKKWLLCCLILAAGACEHRANGTQTPVDQGGQTDSTVAGGIGAPGSAADSVLVGAGDIADCTSSGDEKTAALLDTIPGHVFTLGDNVYPASSSLTLNACYAPTWGRHLDRTRPAAGNHDYQIGSAAYYQYFGTRAGTAGAGYYSYDMVGWHIVVLNSNIDASSASPQTQWLRTDLAAHPAKCTLAYWHHARFSSGSEHGSDPHMRDAWQTLQDAGADVVLSGHDHDYERFAPQTADGTRDDTHGLREFIAGTGGAEQRGFGATVANSEVRQGFIYGVLKLMLHPQSYSWRFIPAAGYSFSDSGTANCH